MRERQARSCGSDGAHKGAAVERNGHVKPRRNRTWRSEGARHCIPEEGRCWLELIARNELKYGGWVPESREVNNISKVDSGTHPPYFTSLLAISSSQQRPSSGIQ